MAGKLGPVQLDGLRALAECGGEWHELTWWVWDTPSHTRRVMVSLAARGLVDWDHFTHPRKRDLEVFVLNPAGRAALEESDS